MCLMADFRVWLALERMSTVNRKAQTYRRKTSERSMAETDGPDLAKNELKVRCKMCKMCKVTSHINDVWSSNNRIPVKYVYRHAEPSHELKNSTLPPTTHTKNNPHPKKPVLKIPHQTKLRTFSHDPLIIPIHYNYWIPYATSPMPCCPW